MALTQIKTAGIADNAITDAKVADAITVAASGLSGNTLASGVTASSLTSVGTLSSLTVSGDVTIPEYIKHTGDTDTFIRFTDGSINFSADNTTPLVLDATSGTGVSIQGHLAIGSGHTPSSDFGFNTHITHIKKDGDIAFILDNATEKFEFCMNNDSDALRICAGSRADILNLDANGNVGINKNAPVIGSGRGLHIRAPEANLHAGLRLDTPSGADWSIIAVDNDQRLLFYDNENTQYGLTIDGQNIGIGTTAVTSDAMLHIKKDQSAYTRFLVENNTNSTSTQALGSFKSNAGTFFMGISSTAHSAGGDVVFNQTATNKGMRWFTNGSLSMRMFDDGDLQLETGTYYVNTPGSSGNAKAGYLFKNSNNIGVAQVRSSGGRGLVLGRQDLSANAFTTIADSHWGGTALVAWAGSGVQGMDMVAYGYNSPVTVLYSSQWAGSQTRTYVGSTYQLQLRLSTAANVWVLFLGT